MSPDNLNIIVVSKLGNSRVMYHSSHMIEIPYKINGAYVYIDASKWDGSVEAVMKEIYKKCGYMEPHLYRDVRSFVVLMKFKKSNKKDWIPLPSVTSSSFLGTPFSECLTIRKVIFNDPATIVFWGDGTKTVVKCQDGDIFDPEKGLAMAITKKALGNKGNYCNELKKWLPKDKEETTIVVRSGQSTAEAIAKAINRMTSAMKEVDKRK